MVRGDIYVYDNSKTHVAGDNEDLVSILRDVGIDAVRLPTYSPELNPVELIFNVLVQKFASQYSEHNLVDDNDVLNLLNSIIDSISGDVIHSCYCKCRHSNFH